MLLSVFSIFAPLQPEKSSLQTFFLYGSVRTYIIYRKCLKAYYLQFAAVFLFGR
nr:MAG TPA: hypothetical protein [Caudoviricetes sp.]